MRKIATVVLTVLVVIVACCIIDVLSKSGILFCVTVSILGVFGLWIAKHLRAKSGLAELVHNHNVAYVTAILAPFGLALMWFTPAGAVVLKADAWDWAIACCALYGTAFISFGAIMSRKEEADMLRKLDEKKIPPTEVLVAVAKAVITASRYCRNGMFFVVVATGLQMAHWTLKAHSDWKVTKILGVVGEDASPSTK